MHSKVDSSFYYGLTICTFYLLIYFIVLGDGNSSRVVKLDLAFNQLTRFESSVVKSVLEKFESLGGFPLAYVNIEESKKTLKKISSSYFLILFVK